MGSRGTYVGSSGLSHAPARAHARLQTAKSAAEIETPCALHLRRAALVRAASNATVGTTVCRGFPPRRAKACPP